MGVGAMCSPRYAPAGLLVERGRTRVMIDGGPGAEPLGALSAWLVTDEHAELMSELRRMARARGLTPRVASFVGRGLAIEPHPVAHTSHPAFGYLIAIDGVSIGWAPEFWRFPSWAAGVDLLFAEAAGWDRPIRFAGGVGGHAPALEVARQARARGVARLVFAHVGRPTIRALDAGARPPFGEMSRDLDAFVVRRRAGGLVVARARAAAVAPNAPPQARPMRAAGPARRGAPPSRPRGARASRAGRV